MVFDFSIQPTYHKSMFKVNGAVGAGNVRERDQKLCYYLALQ